MRSGGLSLAAFALADGWPAAGAMLLVKLPVLAALLVFGYLMLGEFDARERALARSLIRGPKGTVGDE